jgi:hypothetical protein
MSDGVVKTSIYCVVELFPVLLVYLCFYLAIFWSEIYFFVKALIPFMGLRVCHT